MNRTHDLRFRKRATYLYATRYLIEYVFCLSLKENLYKCIFRGNSLKEHGLNIFTWNFAHV